MDEAKSGIARLNSQQPCYFILGFDWSLDQETLAESLKVRMYDFFDQAALLVLPKSFARSEFIPFWPSLVQTNLSGTWICSICFADNWDEVEHVFIDSLQANDNNAMNIHASCQYQPPYTEMLALWDSAGAKSYHPGDYFKEDFLFQLSQMSGTWAYWGHALGDRLRAYGHLDRLDILSHKPVNPLLATLWFTCSTLNPEIEDNIGLVWYLSGSTQCLLASPFKIKTESNQVFGQEFLSCYLSDRNQLLAEIFYNLSGNQKPSLFEIMNQYHLLGNPWVNI